MNIVTNKTQQRSAVRCSVKFRTVQVQTLFSIFLSWKTISWFNGGCPKKSDSFIIFAGGIFEKLVHADGKSTPIALYLNEWQDLRTPVPSSLYILDRLPVHHV